MHAQARQRFSFDEYVRLEELSPIKHEFLDGAVWAMAGGTPEHAAIAANLIALLSSQLLDQPCRVFTSDLRIRVLASGLGTYPDVSVVCGELALDPEDPKGHTVTNPRVIVEVLRPSTEAYDRGEKLDHYLRIPSLQEVVLIAHDTRRIDVCRRADEPAGRWSMETTREGAALVRSLGCELTLDAVYRDPLAPRPRG